LRKVTVDIFAYKSLANWAPMLGDVVFKDGLFFRWCGAITAVDGDDITIKKAGCPLLLAHGEGEDEITNSRKIRNSSGSYYVVRNGTYYV